MIRGSGRSSRKTVSPFLSHMISWYFIYYRIKTKEKKFKNGKSEEIILHFAVICGIIYY